MDELHHQNSLSDTSTAEHRSLAALCEGARRSITLMPVSKTAVAAVSSSSAGGGLWIPRRGYRMARQARGRGQCRPRRVGVPVSRHRPEPKWAPRRSHPRIAGKARGRLERDTADGYGIDMAMHFEDKRSAGPIRRPRRVDRRQHLAVEAHVHDGASTETTTPADATISMASPIGVSEFKAKEMLIHCPTRGIT